MTDLPPPPPPPSPPPPDSPPPPPDGPPPYGAPGSGSAPGAGAAISYGWAKFQQNVGPLLTVALMAGLALILFSLFARFAIHPVPAALLVNVLGGVVSAVIALGLYRMALMITAGESADVGKAFQYDRWGEWIVFSIGFGLLVWVGLVLCIIPGLLVLAYFGLAPFYFLEAGLSGGDALRASRQAVSGRGLAFPILVSIIVGGLGIIAGGVGLLVTWPIAYVAVAYLYRHATGQPVAA